MRALITGCWHLNDTTPANRVDNYPKVQRNKVNYILGLAEEKNVDCILESGDLFDNSKVSHFVTQQYIKVLRKNKIPFLVVPGQHDSRYHVTHDISNTPMKVLDSARVIRILDENPYKIKGVNIYGCAWGQDIFEPETDGYNILVIHKLLVADNPENLKKYAYAGALLKKHRYDLIVAGDNHKTFTVEKKDKLLVNAGSLMRSKTDQVLHKPVVYIYDTEKKKLTEHFIPIQRSDEVFNLTKVEETKKLNKELNAFIDGIVNRVKVEGINFVKNLRRRIKEKEIDKGVVGIIDEVLPRE